MTRLFISEYLCSGAWPEDELAASLAREGRAMLLALLEDAARVPGWSVCATWDRRLGPFPLSAINVRVVRTPWEELQAFDELAASADGVYVIAPELDDQLAMRCRRVLACGGRPLNSSLTAIDTCSDKIATFECLRSAGVPTIPTRLLTLDDQFNDEFPIVVKPRYGAGSQETYRVGDGFKALSQPDAPARGSLNRGDSNPSLALRAKLAESTRSAAPVRQMICQPYVAGRTLSVAAIACNGVDSPEIWPIAEQHLSEDGRFQYLGGRIPIRNVPVVAIATLAAQAVRALPGLRGYVGFDVILPDDAPERPVIVEVNPRLTTSYLGYRALAGNNLAPLVMQAERTSEHCQWKQADVAFDAAGCILRE